MNDVVRQVKQSCTSQQGPYVHCCKQSSNKLQLYNYKIFKTSGWIISLWDLCTLPRFHWLQKQLNSLISTQRVSLHQAKRVRSPAALLQPCNKSVQKKPALSLIWACFISSYTTKYWYNSTFHGTFRVCYKRVRMCFVILIPEYICIVFRVSANKNFSLALTNMEFGTTLLISLWQDK